MSLLAWLSRKPKSTEPPSEASPQGFHLPARVSDLLSLPRRQQLLENIWRRASLSRQQYDALYRQPLERFAELVQLLPASENHHHAHLGGLLDHGLEIVAYALKIRQTYLLPIGAPPESQSAQAEAWSAAAAYGALIHDLGKIAVDVAVELQGGGTWPPWHGPITKPYRFRYVKGREYQLRLQDVDWDNQLILVRGETEKTHREFRVPIVEGLAPHIRRLLLEAERLGFTPKDQLFNVNRFSPHYKRTEMNSDQVEAMYKKLIDKLGVRMTPHRFRHTLATDLMRQPERNIHLTKSLLNHSNIATTMSYIEADYDHMREVLHERSLHQGALQLVRHADETGAPTASKHQVRERSLMEQLRLEQTEQGRGAPMDPATQELASALLQMQFNQVGTEPSLPPEDLFEPSLLFTILSSAAPTPYSRAGSGGGSTRFAARASP